MKKVIISLIALSLALCAAAFSSCDILDVTDIGDQNYTATVFPAADTTYNKGATVTVDGTTTYYEALDDAWIAANTNTESKVIFKLYQDWNSQTSYEENGVSKLSNSRFSNKVGVGVTDTYYLRIETRGECEVGNSDAKSLTIDLNSHFMQANFPDYNTDFRCFIYTDTKTYDETHCPGDITIQNGSFNRGNAVTGGGAIKIEGSKLNLSLRNVWFHSCNTTTNGGGLYISGDSMDITLLGCSMEYCNADNCGGGIYLNALNSKVLFNDDDIQSNTCKVAGPGVYFDYSGSQEGTTTVKMTGQVEIRSNYVGDDRYTKRGVFIGDDAVGKVKFESFEGLALCSCIGFEANQKNVYLTDKISDNRSDTLKNYLNACGDLKTVTCKQELQYVEGCNGSGSYEGTGYCWYIINYQED